MAGTSTAGLLRQAVQHSDDADYAALLEVLAELGRRKNDEGENLRLQNKLRFENAYRMAAFLFAWLDPSLSKSKHKDQRVVVTNLGFGENPLMLRQESERSYMAKSVLNRKDREYISAGLELLSDNTHPLTLPVNNLSDNDEDDLKDRINHHKKYDKKALTAITDYKNTRQKVFSWISRGIAAVMAFACGASGAISVGALIIPALLAAAFAPWLVALLGVLAGAAIAGSFIAGTYCNWRIFKDPVYQFFNDIFAKDNLFQGVYEYINENGVRTEINRDRKWLNIVAFVFSLSAGVGLAAIPYSMMMTLGVTLGMASVAFFPVVGIVLAAASLIAMTALFYVSFKTLLTAENLKDIFRKPFENIKAKFKDEEAISVSQVITYGVTGLLLGLGFAATVIGSIMSAGMLSGFLVQQFSVVPKIATWVGVGVAGIAAGLAQIPFLFESTAKTVINLFNKIRGVEQLESYHDDKRSGLGEVAHYTAGVINAAENGFITYVGMGADLPFGIKPSVGLSAASGSTAAVLSATSVFGSDEADTENKVKVMNRAAGSRMLALEGKVEHELNFDKSGKLCCDINSHSLFRHARRDASKIGAKHEYLLKKFGLPAYAKHFVRV